MKKHLLFTSLILGGIMMAQTGKGVGVETETPTEVFHVEGTTRVTILPKNEAEKAINTDNEGNVSNTKQPFNATRTLVADVHGVLGTIDGLPGYGGQCVKGKISDNVAKDLGENVTEGRNVLYYPSQWGIEFKDFAFTVIQEENNKVFAALSYIKKNLPYNKRTISVSSSEVGGSGAKKESELSVAGPQEEGKGHYNWTTITDSMGDGGAVDGAIMIPLEAATNFNYYLRTIKVDKERYFSFCVEQTEFNN